MSSRSLNRKDFLVLTVSSTSIATFLAACGGDDPATPGGTAGSGGSGTAGTGTAGTGTAGTGTAGTGTSGSASGGTSGGSGGSGGASGGSGGASGGSGGASGGSGGASGGSGGASGGSGGSGGASGGTGGSGGGMCGTVTIMQTGADPAGAAGHDHIPDDATKLKADLKTHINGANSTMMFTLPMEGHSHTITLTAPQVAMLKGGGTVTGVISSKDGMNGGHTHTYTIGCTA